MDGHYDHCSRLTIELSFELPWDFVDVNLGCPIDHFTRKGMGAALGRQPSRVRRIVESMAKAVQCVPVTVKIRLGWNDEMRNHVDLARAAVDDGAPIAPPHQALQRIVDA